MYSNLIKPFLDFFSALLLFSIVIPIFLLITLLLAMHHKGNPFFIQRRPGKNERIFSIVKFKTMNDKRNLAGEMLPDSERLSGLGKFIRSTSLDELPQLVNVLKGDMSFVGPRPLLPEYLPLYSAKQKQRHKVKPGITGWAQVNGRNAISWEEKFELDIFYVQNRTFVLDLKILWKTVQKVFLRSDINTEGVATTKRFTGTKE